MGQPAAGFNINLGEQFDRYYPAVYRYYRYRGVDADTANDLAAEVFERALVKLHTFNPQKAAFNTWIFTIAHNLGINHWKSRSREQGISMTQAADHPSLDLLPEDAAIRQEGVSALLTALQCLEEREREVVGLKFAGALSNRQIAELLHLTDSHVGVILFRALHKLKLELSKNEGQVSHAG